MRDAEHKAHRDRGIHRITARFQHAEAHVSGIRLAADHHAVSSAIRLRPPTELHAHEAQEYQRRDDFHDFLIIRLSGGNVIDQWTKSREYLERARRSLAGGVSSPFRAKAPVPLYFRNGCGARLEDVDGNEYIDYVLAWGP